LLSTIATYNEADSAKLNPLFRLAIKLKRYTLEASGLVIELVEFAGLEIKISPVQFKARFAQRLYNKRKLF
jgi:hypothetical protein